MRSTQLGRPREQLSPRERRWFTIAELGRLALAEHTAEDLCAWTAKAVGACLGAASCQVFELSADHGSCVVLASAGLDDRAEGESTELGLDSPERGAADNRGHTCVAAPGARPFRAAPSDSELGANGAMVAAACVIGTATREVGIRVDAVGSRAIATDMPIFLEVVTNLLGEALCRIEHEERLLEDQLRWRLALDAARVGSWDWDVVNDVFTWDPAMFALTGFPVDVPPTLERFLAAINPADVSRVRVQLTAAMETGAEYDMEFRFLRPDGREIWLEAKGMTLGDQGGGARRVVGVNSDVTARKRAEAIASHRAMDLRATDHHKDEFLAVLSHELRNPLAALASGVDLLRELPAEDRETIHEMIERQLVQLRRLLDDLLDVERIKRGKFQLERRPVDVGLAVRIAVDALRPRITGRGQALSVRIDPDLWVQGDLQRLAQVVGNLLDNACKHTQSSGRIRVVAAREELEVVVRVQDNGRGIEAAELECIFDPFCQAHKTLARGAGGLGLGLTLVRQVVEMHGGTVVAQSGGSGKGSTFELRLLSTRDRPAPRAEPMAAQRPIFAGGLRALVVDDNADFARLLGLRLKGLGLDVVVAHEGEQALRIAKETPPAVMIVDLELPGMAGFELVEALRDEPAMAETLFVSVSSAMPAGSAARARQVGFSHQLSKPVELTELVAALSKLSEVPDGEPEPG